MQKKALVLLILALFLGGVAVILVNMLIKEGREGPIEVQAVPMTRVVVAAVDLKSGTRLNELSLKEVEMPTANLPEGVFKSISTLVPKGEDDPSAPVVISQIKQNEMVLPYKLSPFGARAGLPSKIPEDMRAITINVTEITGVAGFVLPGNYVDVLLTSTIGRRDKNPATRTLLQNIRVLAVDQISTEDEDNPKVVNAVTLLITPNEGKMLALAMKVGELSLMLRNEFDASIIKQEIISITSLLEAYRESKPVVTKRVRRPTPTVEVIRGLDVIQQRVQEGEERPPEGAVQSQ
ncbi:MAG: Flp pilus assembly protein CpaB [Gammaproteobacteria bacterium]|nr:Flp pilus assembly protein CpaB [Gammaproteobacteria bacterium]MCW8972836.1 Flp pilus assembly protein CpaB [Gammaproteobacteria bacterium]MCW8992091.1 Flp pilus assembly protein CpaB [Gammaproteobacteria bacterium]